MTARLPMFAALNGLPAARSSATRLVRAVRHFSVTAAVGIVLIAIASPAGAMQAQAVPAPQAVAPPRAEGSPDLVAKVTTSRGTFSFILHADIAPLAVTNFCNLARKGFFNDLPLASRARVYRAFGKTIEVFDPGYRLRREFSPKLPFDGAGRVAFWRSPTRGDAVPTEFVVTVKAQHTWNLEVAAFGTLREGQAIVNALTENDRITKVEVIGDPAPLFEKYAARIQTWDAALTGAGWTPSAESPAVDAPDQSDAPPSGAPSKDPPSKEAPAKDPPAKDEPAKDAPSKDEPAKDAPPKDAPAPPSNAMR